MSKEYDAKLILVGETNVGKTSLLRQYVDHLFSEEKVTTIGYDTMHKELELPEGKISLQIWDTCGQEQFRTVNQLFVKNSKMALLVYDITNYKTFEELKNFWYSYVTSAVGKNIIFGIAGNKSDLYENEQVKVSDAQQFANEIGAIFKETTAKNHDAITALIEEMSIKFIQQIGEENKNENNKIVISNTKNKKKEGCCNKKKHE
jgi:small GTP-binding protein